MAESFARETSHAYDVEALECHGCAAKERRVWMDSQSRESDQPPLFGRFYRVTLDEAAIRKVG